MFLSFISLKLKKIETISKVKYQNIALNRILKKLLNKNLNNFLSII